MNDQERRAQETIAALCGVLGLAQPAISHSLLKDDVQADEIVKVADEIVKLTKEGVKASPSASESKISIPNTDTSPEEVITKKTTKTETTTKTTTTIDFHSVAAWSVGVKHRKKHRELSSESYDDESSPSHRPSPNSVRVMEELEGELSLDTPVAPRTLLEEEDPMSSNKGVNFRNHISLVEIPHHKDLDPAMAQSLFTSSEEVHINRERNLLEFHWVGGEWTKALEEDEMIYDEATGQYIHPATWEQMQHEAHMREMSRHQALARQQWLLQQAKEAAQLEWEKIENIPQGSRKESLSKESSPKERRRRRNKSKERKSKSESESSPFQPRKSSASSPTGRKQRRNTGRPKKCSQPLTAGGASLTRFADT